MKQSKGSEPRQFMLNFDRAKLALVGLVFLLSTSAGFLGGWLASGSRQHQETQTAQEVVVNEGQAISEIVDEVGESIVSVHVVTEQTSLGFFGPSTRQQAGAGSGFIISEDGTVLTNRHVVPEGTAEVSLTLSDGTELDDVEVIGRTGANDPLDIAFLKINDARGNQLKPVELGNSGEVQVGDRVIAIGNALGQFQNTVTSGIISGFGRNVRAGGSRGADTLQNLFQTDAAINQGNSGGPLVNFKGEVIGVNTAVARGDGTEGIGFSIPIDDVKGLISSVLNEGELQRPYIGVRYVQLNEGLAEQFDLDVTSGAYIVPAEEGEPSSVMADSPADEAGLQEGDIITHVGSEEIDGSNSLASLIGRLQVGEQVTLTIIRDGQEQSISVRLGEFPQN